MNFVDKFDAKLPFDGPDQVPDKAFHVDSFSVHAPADAIVVPDVHLLFGGDYKRSGVDLILSDSDHELVVHDYFKGEKRAALAAPDGGAHLTGDVVSALAGGHVEYAQAGGAAAAASVVGHVTKLVGSATAVRNGVSIILTQGDNVEKGDVLQTGSDSTLGVTFVDSTVFGLSSNARMVVNELVYDPNGSNNSSLLSLVSGTISFVAGETAKHGDMKVDTPVATMGIRGTAVLVQIDFDTPGGTPDAKFQVLVEPDGHTGSYILYDKTTLDPIATVNQAGHQVNISHGVVTYSTNGLSPELQKLITDVFSLKFSDNTNPNTKSLDHFTDSIVPLSITPFKFVNAPNLTPIVFTVSNAGDPVQFLNFGPFNQIQHISIAPTVSAQSGAEAERIGVTGISALDTVSGKIIFSDINLGDRPTASIVFDAVSYQTTQQQNVTSLLSKQQLTTIESAISISQDPGNTNQGSATWTYSISDKAFDFLGAGETLTLTYLVEVNNNFGQAPQVTTVPITITITGTNDAPHITSSVPQTIAFNGSVSGGDLVAKGPTSGKLTFSDPDLTDTHTVSVALADTTLGGHEAILPQSSLQALESALSASIAADSTDTGSGTINWSLANLPADIEKYIPEGEVLTLTYVVTVTDSQGATATQDITVTIGSGVVWIATSADGSPTGGLWSNPSNWSSGTVPTASDDVSIISDPKGGLTPSYPVTIEAVAAANSLTMNDLGKLPPELINESTLTITGAFTLNADSIVENYGTITVGGPMEIGDQSVLHNFGTLKLEDGGDFSAQSTISNAADGTIEISGGTLNVEADIDNAGLIVIDKSGTVVLEAAAISGGTLDNRGTLDIEGASTATLDGVTMTGSGTVDVDAPHARATTLVLQDGTTMTGGKLAIGAVGTLAVKGAGGATLNGVSITNGNAIEIFAASLLALAAGTTVANNGTITVDSFGTLALNDASITGGTIADLNGGHVKVDAGQTLTLDNVTVSYASFNDGGPKGGIIQVDGGDTLTLRHATITGGAINGYSATSGGIVDAHLAIIGSSTIRDASLNHGNVAIEGGQTLTLDNVTVSDASLYASGAIIQIDGGDTLTLDDVTITGGTINGYSDVAGHLTDGYLDVTVSSGIIDAGLNHVHVTIESGQALALDNVTVNHTSFDDTASGTVIRVDNGDTLTLYEATITGGTVDNYSSLLGGVTGGHIDVTGSSSMSDVELNHGDVTIAARQKLTLDDVAATGTVFDNEGATIQVDSGDKLILNGVTIDGGTVAVKGALEIAGPSTIEHAVVDHAHITVDSGQTLTLEGVAAHGSTITLAGNDDTLNVDSAFHGAIAGLSSGDIINLTGIAYSARETAVWNNANHTLTISNGMQTEVLKLEGNYTQNDFTLADNGGHTELLYNDAPPTLAVIDPPVETVILPAVHDRGVGPWHAHFIGPDFGHGDQGFGWNDHLHLAPLSGAISVSGADVGDKLTASLIGEGVVDYNGSSSLPKGVDMADLINPDTVKFDSVTSDGGSDLLHWTYNPGSANFDFLQPGDRLTLTFEAEVHEGAVNIGEEPLTVTIVAAGGSTVKGTSGDDTFVNVGGGVKIFGDGGHDAFVFNDHFGSATIADFNVNQDTIDLSRKLFSNVSEILASAHPADWGHDTVIDAGHNKITLVDVTVAQLHAHANDFHLV